MIKASNIAIGLISALLLADGPAVAADDGEALRACYKRGIAYNKEIGSYPRLSDGRLAEDVVIARCRRSTQAF